MSRALSLTQSATWWPSVLWQTTTLELTRNSSRLLVDPGIAPWEALEAARDGASQLLITHADWDHVMGIGLMPDARVWASAEAAERIRSGEARESVEKEVLPYGVPVEALDGMRVDELVPTGGESYAIGPWQAESHATPGHTPDGITTWLPEENLLVVGDYLGMHEVPFIYDSAWNYRTTLELLSTLIEQHQPAHVVVGHGRPHTADRALALASEDLDYVNAVIAFADAGGDPEQADQVPYPERGGSGDDAEHRSNITLACAHVAG